MLPVNQSQPLITGKDAMKTANLADTESLPVQTQISCTDSARVLLRYNTDWKAFELRLVGGVFLAFITAALLLLGGCSSEPGKPAESKPEVKTPDLITGRSGFQKAYVAARGWSQDAQPYRLESTITTDGNGHDGKAAIWRGSFGSPSRRSEKSYTWSGSTADGAPEKGVNPGIEDSYSPTNSSTHIFDMAFLKIDSDQAFATAQKHGGDKILEKEADTPVSYVCDWNHNTNELIWHVIYGTSRDNAKLKVAVNASTGEFIRVEK
jgi:hypothetical protein